MIVIRGIRHFYFLLKSFLKELKPSLILYKHIYRKRILKTPVFECDQDNDFEIHMLVSKKDILNGLWSLKTFFYWSGMRPVVVIHEDGSFDDKDSALFSKHFKGSRVIRKGEADKDMKKYLSEYDNVSKFRQRSDFYCALKLFDVLHYSNADNLLIIDSDVLFFRKPVEMMRHIQNNKPFFNGDRQDAYAPGAREYFKKLGMPIDQRINAGLMYINKQKYIKELACMDAYFQYMNTFVEEFDINRHEQTIHAALLTKYNACRLGSEYQIAPEPLQEKTISHHFVADGGRNDFYVAGLRKIGSQLFEKDKS